MNDFYVYIHKTISGVPFYVGKGRKNRAYSKHGRNSFWKRVVAKHGLLVEFIHLNLSESEAFYKEAETIKLYKENHRLCNMTLGGGGTSGWVQSQETKDKISKKNKGRTHTLESKFLIAATWRGRKHSEKTKELIKSKWYKDHDKSPKLEKLPIYSKNSFEVYKSGLFIGIWSSKSKCAKDLGISQPNISNCLYGKRSIHCGYTFKEIKGG